VGGNIVAANLVTQVKPVYPQFAHDGGIEGIVRLQGVISVDGTLTGLRVVSSNHPALASSALQSVKQWRYRPAMLNGEPIEISTEIDVEFKIAQ
jgi:protein TonB